MLYRNELKSGKCEQTLSVKTWWEHSRAFRFCVKESFHWNVCYFFRVVREGSREDEKQLRSVERAAPGRVAPALRHVHGRRQRVHRASRPRAGAVPQSRAQRDVPTTCRKYQRSLIKSNKQRNKWPPDITSHVGSWWRHWSTNRSWIHGSLEVYKRIRMICVWLGSRRITW